MRYRIGLLSLALIAMAATALAVTLFGCRATASPASTQTAASAEPTPGKKGPAERVVEHADGEFDGKEIVKSNDEWKKELTPVEYNVMREEGTEAPLHGQPYRQSQARHLLLQRLWAGAFQVGREVRVRTPAGRAFTSRYSKRTCSKGRTGLSARSGSRSNVPAATLISATSLTTARSRPDYGTV